MTSSTSSSQSEIKLFVKRLTSTAVIPTRATAHAAGYDLSASKACTVPAHGKAIVSTDLAIALPEHTYGRVAPRSGISWKWHLDIAAGVLDPDYRGAVGVMVFNHGDKDFPIAVGDRVAQLILERFAVAEVVEVQELDDTTRGSGGFGSTGVSKIEHSSIGMSASSSSSGSSSSSSLHTTDADGSSSLKRPRSTDGERKE